jgi:hypothetical protein
MKLFWRSLLFFTFASFTPLAFGQTIFWRNTGSGTDTNFDNDLNWTTDINDNPPTGIGSLPSSTSDVRIYPGFYLIANPTVINEVTIYANGASTITINTQNNPETESVNDLLVSGEFGALGTASNPILNLNMNGGSNLAVGGSSGVVITGSATVNFSVIWS